MRGWQWPCVVTHQLEMPSIRVEPSAQCSRASLARVTRGIASFRPCCVKGSQTGGALSVFRVFPVGLGEPTHPDCGNNRYVLHLPPPSNEMERAHCGASATNARMDILL